MSLVLCMNWAVSVYSTVCTMFRNFTLGLIDRDVCILAYFLLNSFLSCSELNVETNGLHYYYQISLCSDNHISLLLPLSNKIWECCCIKLVSKPAIHKQP